MNIRAYWDIDDEGKRISQALLHPMTLHGAASQKAVIFMREPEISTLP
jgi:hypothetical protein